MRTWHAEFVSFRYRRGWRCAVSFLSLTCPVIVSPIQSPPIRFDMSYGSVFFPLFRYWSMRFAIFHLSQFQESVSERSRNDKQRTCVNLTWPWLLWIFYGIAWPLTVRDRYGAALSNVARVYHKLYITPTTPQSVRLHTDNTREPTSRTYIPAPPAVILGLLPARRWLLPRIDKQ